MLARKMLFSSLADSARAFAASSACSADFFSVMSQTIPLMPTGRPLLSRMSRPREVTKCSVPSGQIVRNCGSYGASP